MRFFFLSTIPEPGQEASLPPAEATHAVRVLRLREGDPIGLLNGAGIRARAEVTVAACVHRREEVRCRIGTREEWAPPRTSLHLFVAPPRHKYMAQVVRDATELGIARISPVLCEYSVAKPESAAVLAEWRADAVTAAKQSGNPFLPSLFPPADFAAALARAPVTGWFGDLAGAGTTPVGKPAAGNELGVWIGPEGGFSPAEKAALRDRGLLPLQVGAWTLRVETAVPAILGFLLGMGGDDYRCHPYR
jgi:16S rRNA (uracil1498-N3)-methyltransferase